jgi:branched-chain amino acid transport system ATP-binding protein
MLETEGLTIRFGGHVAVDGVSCAFRPGTLTAIVGPNGAGKTTYFNLISGQLAATSGRVRLNGRDVTGLAAPRRARLGLGRAFQLTNLFPTLTALENVRLAVQARSGRSLDLLSRAATHRDLAERAMTHLAAVALAGSAASIASTLSHGDQRKLEVAILLALEPEVFMFDEPTAGMSIDEVPTVLDIIAAIKARGDKTILLVEHKMDVVRSLSDRIVVLHHGRLVADGPPAEVISSDVVREAYLGGAAGPAHG